MLTESVGSRRCLLHCGWGHSHEDHSASGGFHSWHHWTIVHPTVAKPLSHSVGENCALDKDPEKLVKTSPSEKRAQVASKQVCISEVRGNNKKGRFRCSDGR